jgi:hypothetical protein
LRALILTISLATAENLNDWLDQDFGLRFYNDVVLDYNQSFESPLNPVSTNFDDSSFITTNGIPFGQAAAIFEVPNSIRISASPRANVNIDSLLRSTFDSYSKTDLGEVLNNEIILKTEDAQGSFTLAASVENVQTGSRVVLFGSTSLGMNDYADFQGIDNLSVAFNSLVWVTHFNEYFDQMIDRRETATAQALDRIGATSTPSATPRN